MTSARNASLRAAVRRTLSERVGRLQRSKTSEEPVRAEPPAEEAADPRLDELRIRVERLESELEGLQDAMHREGVRQSKRIDELVKAIQPGAMARTLSEDARRRGI
jgi:hypothetical protein